MYGRNENYWNEYKVHSFWKDHQIWWNILLSFWRYLEGVCKSHDHKLQLKKLIRKICLLFTFLRLIFSVKATKIWRNVHLSNVKLNGVKIFAEIGNATSQLKQPKCLECVSMFVWSLTGFDNWMLSSALVPMKTLQLPQKPTFTFHLHSNWLLFDKSDFLWNEYPNVLWVLI